MAFFLWTAQPLPTSDFSVGCQALLFTLSCPPVPTDNYWRTGIGHRIQLFQPLETKPGIPTPALITINIILVTSPI